MIQIDQEAAQEAQVLKQLQEIVPTIPKDGAVSNLDIIENVIQYIMVLQNELEQEEPTNQIHLRPNSSCLMQECNNLFSSNLQSKTI